MVLPAILISGTSDTGVKSYILYTVVAVVVPHTVLRKFSDIIGP